MSLDESVRREISRAGRVERRRALHEGRPKSAPMRLLGDRRRHSRRDAARVPDGRRAVGAAHPRGHQGLLVVADDSAAIREGRVPRRLRHRAGDVRLGRALRGPGRRARRVDPPAHRAHADRAARARRPRRPSTAAAGRELHLSVDPQFQSNLSIAPRSRADVEAIYEGLVLLLDPISASRADGITIDVSDTPNGQAFRVDNPNAPQVRQMSVRELSDNCSARASESSCSTSARPKSARSPRFPEPSCSTNPKPPASSRCLATRSSSSTATTAAARSRPPNSSSRSASRRSGTSSAASRPGARRSTPTSRATSERRALFLGARRMALQIINAGPNPGRRLGPDPERDRAGTARGHDRSATPGPGTFRDRSHRRGVRGQAPRPPAAARVRRDRPPDVGPECARPRRRPARLPLALTRGPAGRLSCIQHS